jgi:thioredoxin reductase
VTERDVYDITIVGGGPSGLYAAFYAAEAAVAVNCARNYLDPTAQVFPGHSSDRDGESP